MSDTIQNDYQLDALAHRLAVEILAEVKEYGGYVDDLISQYADCDEHVIYYHKAHAICQNCDVTHGEDFVRDIGEPKDGWTYDGMASTMAYGELQARISMAVEAIREEDEAA